MVFDMLDEGPEPNAQCAHLRRHEGAIDDSVAHDAQEEVFA